MKRAEPSLPGGSWFNPRGNQIGRPGPMSPKLTKIDEQKKVKDRDNAHEKDGD